MEEDLPLIGYLLQASVVEFMKCAVKSDIYILWGRKERLVLSSKCIAEHGAILVLAVVF